MGIPFVVSTRRPVGERQCRRITDTWSILPDAVGDVSVNRPHDVNVWYSVLMDFTERHLVAGIGSRSSTSGYSGSPSLLLSSNVFLVENLVEKNTLRRRYLSVGN